MNFFDTLTAIRMNELKASPVSVAAEPSETESAKQTEQNPPAKTAFCE